MLMPEVHSESSVFDMGRRPREFLGFLLCPRAESGSAELSPAGEHTNKKGRRVSQKKREGLDGKVV